MSKRRRLVKKITKKKSIKAFKFKSQKQRRLSFPNLKILILRHVYYTQKLRISFA